MCLKLFKKNRMAKKKKAEVPSADKNMEQLELSYIAGGVLNDAVTLKKWLF